MKKRNLSISSIWINFIPWSRKAKNPGISVLAEAHRGEAMEQKKMADAVEVTARKEKKAFWRPRGLQILPHSLWEGQDPVDVLTEFPTHRTVYWFLLPESQGACSHWMTDREVISYKHVMWGIIQAMQVGGKILVLMSFFNVHESARHGSSCLQFQHSGDSGTIAINYKASLN